MWTIIDFYRGIKLSQLRRRFLVFIKEEANPTRRSITPVTAAQIVADHENSTSKWLGFHPSLNYVWFVSGRRNVAFLYQPPPITGIYGCVALIIKRPYRHVNAHF